MGIDLFGQKAKTKSAWEVAPGNVKQLVNDNAVGLVGISVVARRRLNSNA